MALNNNERSKSRSLAMRRVASVVGGAAYICFVSLLLSLATDSPFPATLLTVATCAAVEMLVICELSRRLFLSNEEYRRYSLGTLLLIMTGLSIYLAAIGCMVRAIPDDADDLALFEIIFLSGYAAFFVLISTAVLIYFAEALVWAGISVATRIRIRRKKRLRGKPAN